VGLDHLAFRVADRDELQQWVTRLTPTVYRTRESSTPDSGPTVVFRDPDNMQLEFYVHPDTGALQLSDADSPEAQQILSSAP
jgi:glyoxylase I family protein